MTKQSSKTPQGKGPKKREGLSKRFIQKVAEEMQSIQTSKHSNS